jgi:hypothetical protein
MNNQSPEAQAVRNLASELLEDAGDIQKLDLQRSSDVGKWGLAALLTINGGGLLAVLNAQSRFLAAYKPASFFMGGMVLALLCAAAVRLDIYKSLHNGRGLLRKAKQVRDEKPNAPKTVEELVSEWRNSRTTHLRYWPIGIEALSLLAFLCGSMLALATIDPGERANARRCEALQGDFLSAYPRRADSREVFQILGCRPHGDGNVFAKPKPQTPALAH